MHYREIKQYQSKNLMTEFLVSTYCYLFSPFLTQYFLKKKTIPNVVTVYMIVSGMVGAVLFAIPTVLTQILGAIFIHLWFVLDCSDGEVARITEKFSRFGKEMDYTAHVVDHPLFCLAFLSAMYFSGNYPPVWCVVLLFLLFIGDNWSRHLCSFEDIYTLKSPQKENSEVIPSKKVQIESYIRNSLLVFPNYALIFPLFFFVDCIFGTKSALWLTAFYTVTNWYYIPRLLYGWVRRILHT